MMNCLQQEQLRFYTIKRMGINVLTGECSILLGSFVPYLSGIVCKVRLCTAGFGAVTLNVTFSPLDSSCSIPGAVESQLRIMVLRVVGPWFDRLEICPTTGVII
jgi:hypothetical protein